MEPHTPLPDTTPSDPTVANGSNQQNRRNPRQRTRNPSANDANTSSRPPRPKQSAPRPTPSTSGNDGNTLTIKTGNTNGKEGSQPRNPRRTNPAPKPVSNPVEGSATQAKKEGNRRGANFGSGLTQPGADATSNTPKPQGKRGGKYLPQGDDLTSSLIRGLSSPPYPDCPICFSAIRPEQAIWSCSPSVPIVTSSEAQVQQYCWTSFHVKCIRSWADKSVKEMAEAWRARGEPDKRGDWRCPGCQAKREAVPSGYWCFCNSISEPKPLRLSTPHSCGNSCSRPRESGCGHPCPLQCHPGPCPPCQVTTRLECHCPKKTVLSFRCGIDTKGKGVRDLSCGKVCERTLRCGKHACKKICHAGDCGECELTELAQCWCGKEEKRVPCGEGKEVQCFVEGEQPWIGRFGCDRICDRPFDCGIHRCKKSCHPPSSKSPICPRSPSKTLSCPCGKGIISPSPNSDASQYAFPARLNCSDPIPTCDSICSKPHLACSHPCSAKCHENPCPPCTVEITRPCRCGATTKRLSCHNVHLASALGIEEKEILCDKACLALRACGRHQCRRICCPLASLALNAGKKGKRRAAVEEGIGEEQGGLHECDLVCGKPLSCGNHKCEQRDHRGVCPPCLRSSFEELVCACGRTVYEPPIPCGTCMQCHYPCPRLPPPCGHLPTPHSCHDDSVSCPPCAHLAAKQCACGKKVVPNQRCSLETEKVSCGTVCGKLMACGFHHCERLCHGDDCGPCTAPCGKARKTCLPNHHPCTLPCHAPSSCPETDPCQSLVTLTCPCGRIRQSVHCAKAVSSRGSAYSQTAPKCSTDCQIAKRNARLADALGINTESRDKAASAVTYMDDLLAFARANNKFLPVVEKAFADFVSSEKRIQVLPHMPPDRRKFVHDLAAVYRIDTQMVDQEPNRSVQLLRRVDTRIPNPVLSTYITSVAPPSLGKLADFRSLRGTPASSWRSAAPSASPSPKPQANASAVSSSTANVQRGWTSVVSTAAGSSTATAGSRPSSSLARFGAASGTSTPAAPASRNRATSPVNVPVASAAVSDAPVPANWEDDV